MTDPSAPAQNVARTTLSDVKKLVKAEAWDEAWAGVQALAHPSADFTAIRKLSGYFEKILAGAGASLELAPIKVAVVATSTIDHFVPALKLWLGCKGFRAEIHTGEFNTLPQQVLDPNSGLYAFEPDVIWLMTSWRDVRLDVVPGTSDVTEAVDGAVNQAKAYWAAIKKNSKAFVIQNNADLPRFSTFGNFEGSVPWSKTNLLRRYNLALADALEAGVALFDLEQISGRFGRDRWEDPRWWFHSKHAFDLEATPTVAHAGAALVASLKGKAKKCLVLDLDNTLWGGVIGDDGVEGIRLGSGAEGEAFVAFQAYAKSLKARGVVLAVCSKNEDDAARIPFEKHPDMQLRLEDIAVFVANWRDKASNIRHIAETLNIGLDSVVFVDDNPVERALVKSELPMVSVIDIPPDASRYVEALESERLFETISFSKEDAARAEMYRQNAQRKEAESSFTDMASFLGSLKMSSTLGMLDDFHLPRFVQLINKSNQFHLTTIRYSEADVVGMLASDKHDCVYFKLEDKFGDNGLISTVILEQDGDTLNVDTWAMSCRVLSRGMEEFILREIIVRAKARGCTTIRGKYIPTKKNKLVKELYARLGFEKVSDEDGTTLWTLPAAAERVDPLYIERCAAEGV